MPSDPYANTMSAIQASGNQNKFSGLNSALDVRQAFVDAQRQF